MRISLFTRAAAGTALVAALVAVPAEAVVVAPYVMDPTFNGGSYFLDAFASSPAADYTAKRLVRLDNGDVVVAGTVPDLRGGNVGALGLVRYNAAGQRVAWSNPGAVGYNGNQYIVYNPTSLVPHPIDDIKAIKIYGDRIFVLAETEKSGLSNTFPPHPIFTGFAADVYVFGVDGSFLASSQVGSYDSGSDNRDFFAGGIVVYANNVSTFNSPISLAFAGYQVESGIAKPVFNRLTVNSDSTLSGGTGQVYVNPGVRCNAGCEINGIALGGRLITSTPPRLYLGGSRLNQNKDWDFMAMQVSSNGALATSFSGDGMAEQPFNLAFGTYEDHGRDIFVVPGGFTTNDDHVFVAGDVGVNCGDGFGIVKFKSDGTPDTSFGPGGLGRLLFGDSYSSTSVCALPRTDNRLHAIAVDGNSIAVVGQRNTGSIFIGSSQKFSDAVLAEFDGTGSSINTFNKFPFSDTPGVSRTRDSALWDIVPAGSGTFTATGFVTYSSDAGSLSNHTQFATARFAPQVDEIFGNGFGG
ncbi:MAG: hypothetical protein ABJB01_14030 [Rudaea sp.]